MNEPFLQRVKNRKELIGCFESNQDSLLTSVRRKHLAMTLQSYEVNIDMVKDLFETIEIHLDPPKGTNNWYSQKDFKQDEENLKDAKKVMMEIADGLENVMLSISGKTKPYGVAEQLGVMDNPEQYESEIRRVQNRALAMIEKIGGTTYIPNGKYTRTR